MLDKAKKLPLTYIDSLSFEFGNVHEMTQLLVAKQINDKQYLLSPDFSFIQSVTTNEIDFEHVNKVKGIFFQYNAGLNKWEMVNYNPYLEVVYI